MAMTANKVLSVFISNGISEAQSNKKVKKIASNQPRTITARTSLFTKTEDVAPPHSKIPILENAPIAEPMNNAIHYTVKFYIEAVKPGT